MPAQHSKLVTFLGYYARGCEHLQLRYTSLFGHTHAHNEDLNRLQTKARADFNFTSKR